jgi:hypothetical protein
MLPRTKNAGESEPALDAALPDDEMEPAPDLVESPAAPVGPGPAGASGRKALGGKEPIPFRWKLLGVSEGLHLTLFKAVEREDVEAQLERVRKEGFYTDLRVLSIDTKVAQPKAAKAKFVADLQKEAAAPQRKSGGPKAKAAQRLVARKPALRIDKAAPKKEPASKPGKGEKSKSGKAALATVPAAPSGKAAKSKSPGKPAAKRTKKKK